MKKLSDKKLRKLISDQCPEVRFIWLTDRECILPPIADVGEKVHSSQVARMKFIGDLQDCDDFALQFHAELKRIRGAEAEAGQLPKEQWKSWAVGECFGIKFNGVAGSHNLNMAVCEEGVYLIEPQTKEVWKTDPNKDTILLVRA